MPAAAMPICHQPIAYSAMSADDRRAGTTMRVDSVGCPQLPRHNMVQRLGLRPSAYSKGTADRSSLSAAESAARKANPCGKGHGVTRAGTRIAILLAMANTKPQFSALELPPTAPPILGPQYPQRRIMARTFLPLSRHPGPHRSQPSAMLPASVPIHIRCGH
jgi:hypothetical protein